MQFQVQNGQKEAVVSCEGEFQQFQIDYAKAFSNVLKKIKKTYGAFPTGESPVTKFTLKFNNGEKEEISVEEETILHLDLKPLKDIRPEKYQEYIEYIYATELYQGIAHYHHQEQEIRKELQEKIKAEEDEVKSTRKILERAIELIKEHKNNPTKEIGEKRIQYFNTYFFDKFHVLLEEMGVSVLAAEMKDYTYFDAIVFEEKKDLIELKETLKTIQECKKQGIEYAEILEFTTLYEFMPLRILPYNVLFADRISRYRVPSIKIIKDFEQAIETTDIKVRFAFKKFWNQCKQLFNQEQIKHGIFKMEIQHHLYDAFYLDRAYETYTTLKEQSTNLANLYRKDVFTKA